MTAQQRVAIVTGGAQGIGAAVTRRLAADGLAVAVLDRLPDGAREVAEGIRAGGGRASAFAVDVTDEASVTGAVTAVAGDLGSPTVLVNNAGITRDNLLFKMSVEDWESVMAVHLRGAFLLSRAVQKYMVDAGEGRIVNMSSGSALGNRGQANYSAAKAGIQGLTKTLAIELGRFGVTANCVAPGFIETDMTRTTAQRLGWDFEAMKTEAAGQIPVGRVGQPEDVADLVAYLVSPGSAYVSGQVIYVAGGPKT
jgi:3-oxoacyl-[acyl-carrier protein] reductase